MCAKKVIRFWWLNEEERKFIDFLEKTGTVIAYPGGAFWTKEELSPKPIRRCIEEDDPIQLKLSMLGIFPNPVIVSTGRLSEPNLHISLHRSYVIVYKRGKLQNQNILTAYHLSVELNDLVDGKLVGKTIEFVKWVDKIFRWVRKSTPEKYGKYDYRVSKKVMEKIKNGLRIAEY